MVAKFYGFNPPFKGGKQNILSRQEDEQLIKNDILQLLLTVPGERLHRPDFGTNLRSYVFEILDDTTTEMLRTEIIASLSKYEKRVKIDVLQITQEQTTNSINIKLVTSMISSPETKIVIDRTFAGTR